MVWVAGGGAYVRSGLVMVAAAAVLVLSGCFWERAGSGVEVVPAAPVRQEAPLNGEIVVGLTKEAGEWRRVREEHKKLIETIPTLVPVEPAKTQDEEQRDAVARIVHNPDGLPYTIPVDENWFDPMVGLRFFRPRGGDWTGSIVRKKHSHRRLFYYDRYPEDVANFGDRSIYRGLARELAFEASEAVPVLGEPTPALVGALEDNLGWELRPAEGPLVNVWSWVYLNRGGGRHRFAVGGVMRMGVEYRGEGEERLEYLVIGDWVGSVVVERLE